MPEGPFQLIYADPPWQLGNPEGAYAPENHYSTMPLEQIKQLAVPAAESSVLLLWAVNCLLPAALEVIAAWGFEYKSNLVWDKLSIGPGQWLRQQHELLLIASRGGQAPPAEELRFASVLQAKRRRHSQKPDEVYALLERAYPHLSKLELFARQARPGWAAFGNQLPKEQS
jgi:N6-adenosine-specific RNA methylase IME4